MGAMDARNMYSNLTVNKYLHTVGSCWISSICHYVVCFWISVDSPNPLTSSVIGLFLFSELIVVYFYCSALSSRFAGASAKLRKATVSFVMSVRPSAWNNWASTRPIFMEFDVWVNFLKKMSRKSRFNPLTFWHRNYFFLILAHPVYKMWIIQEPNTLELWNKLHFEDEKAESIYHV